MNKKIYNESYKGFEIIGKYDENIRRLNPDSQTVEKVGGITFSIFDAEDVCGSSKLFSTSFGFGYELSDDSDETFSNAVIEYVDNHANYLASRKNEEIGKRRFRQLSKAVAYIAKDVKGEALYRLLSDDFGMTDHDIFKAGCSELISYFDLEKYAEVIAGYLVRLGTWETSSGNYHISFKEVEEEFGLDLTSDEDMVSRITDSVFDIHGDIVAELDVYDNEFDFMFFLNYCPNADADDDN